MTFIAKWPLGIAIGLVISTTAVAKNPPNYTHYINPDAINYDLSSFSAEEQKFYDKVIYVSAPSGGKIPILAAPEVSKEQLLRSYNIMTFFLTNFDDLKYGTNRGATADQMVRTGAKLVMPDGEDGDSRVAEQDLTGQPLYQFEAPTAGSADYINNNYEHRDASYEEIFHLVHHNGFGQNSTLGVLSDTWGGVELKAAMESAIDKNLWQDGFWFGIELRQWLAEDAAEYEYFVSIMDACYGYWGEHLKTKVQCGGAHTNQRPVKT